MKLTKQYTINIENVFNYTRPNKTKLAINMHHLRGAMQHRQALSPLTDFGEILCRRAWIYRSHKQHLNLISIVMWP